MSGAKNDQRGAPLWTPPETRATEPRGSEVNDMGAPPPEIRGPRTNSYGSLLPRQAHRTLPWEPSNAPPRNTRRILSGASSFRGHHLACTDIGRMVSSSHLPIGFVSTPTRCRSTPRPRGRSPHRENIPRHSWRRSPCWHNWLDWGLAPSPRDKSVRRSLAPPSPTRPRLAAGPATRPCAAVSLAAPAYQPIPADAPSAMHNIPMPGAR